MPCRPDPIAYPPRGMSRDEAARYVGPGATKFDEMVADGRMPRPNHVDGRVIWDRLKIEAAFSESGYEPNERALGTKIGGARLSERHCPTAFRRSPQAA